MLYGTSAQALTSLGVSAVCDLVNRINRQYGSCGCFSVCLFSSPRFTRQPHYYNSCTEVIINTVTSDLEPNSSEYERIMSGLCMFMISKMYNRLPNISFKGLVLGYGIMCLEEN